MPVEERALTSGTLSKEPRIDDWRSAYKHQRDRKASEGALPQGEGWSRATVSSRGTSLTWPSAVCLAVKPVGEPDLASQPLYLGFPPTLAPGIDAHLSLVESL